ncbi:hypothetical protein MMC27_003954 [Xylographa pallens]|nr:hypothetical protein [Xylographa pallens]
MSAAMAPNDSSSKPEPEVMAPNDSSSNPEPEVMAPNDSSSKPELEVMAPNNSSSEYEPDRRDLPGDVCVPKTPAIVFSPHENKLEMMYNTSKGEFATLATFLHIYHASFYQGAYTNTLTAIDIDYTNYQVEGITYVLNYRRVMWCAKRKGIYQSSLSDDQMTEFEKMKSEKCNDMYVKMCLCADCDKYNLWDLSPPQEEVVLLADSAVGSDDD